ncbi:MAG: hypothetical protein NC432_07930 [Roseburia sp.]|nr:hypothetical protein [Roseburia sp.]MCM1097864.1 hypothetical protein [Ruminococcus flavefaciens]
MKKNKIGIRIIAVFCAALGWWGLLYPELTLTPDIVRVIREAEDGAETVTDRDGGLTDSLYLELLGAERGSIRFRSRLLTELNAFWEAFSWDRSTEN